ncbi:hypothetical protein SORBI_3007G102600 [Sorghum bicolor]|uniref:Uncharacterized protein n=1 Tax=Sorghum bicolor TaxID=4558 RepID=A0A1B6PH88_SORBI|nr:hypothetical protein SORBI_3007G102600 [Sorghum bicolor]
MWTPVYFPTSPPVVLTSDRRKLLPAQRLSSPGITPTSMTEVYPQGSRCILANNSKCEAKKKGMGKTL